MIYNFFGIWNWNIYLVSLFVYLLSYSKIKFNPTGSPVFIFPSNGISTSFTSNIWTGWLVSISLNLFMSVCACKIVNTIQVYQIWFTLSLFVINTVDLVYSVLFAINAVIDEMIISFCYSCKIKRLSCEQLICTSWYKLFEVYPLFLLACRG